MPTKVFEMPDGSRALMNLAGEVTTITVGGKPYCFEWNNFSGWMPTNKDGSDRLSPVPKKVWDVLKREAKKPI